MKQLLWKEWMELRAVPRACAAFMAICVIVCKIFILCLHEKAPNMMDAVMYAYLAAPLVALYVGAGLLSSEVDGGTLPFIATLPVSRGRIWFTKILAGWLTITLSVIAMSVTGILLAALLGANTRISNSDRYWSTPNGMLQFAELSVLLPLWCFALAVMVSPLTDNLAAGLIMSIVAAGVFWVLGLTNSTAGNMAIPFAVVSIAVFLMTSFQTFTRGESLRTPRRFYITGGILACFAAGFGLFMLVHG